MFNNNEKKITKDYYEFSDIPEDKAKANAEVMDELKEKTQIITEQLRKDIVEFHEKMSKKYGKNYCGTSVMCSYVVDSGKGIKTLANANFADYNLKTKNEAEKIIEALKFIAEKVGEKIQNEMDLKFPEEDINMEKARKIADGVLDITNFIKEFFGENVYKKMYEKNYLDPYGMIDLNNKKAFDFVKKILDKKDKEEQDKFWKTLKSKFKEVMNINV